MLTVQSAHGYDLYMRSAMQKTIRRKNYRIDVSKLNRARRALRTRTETETIHRALELAADEAELAKALVNLIEKGHGKIVDIGDGR